MNFYHLRNIKYLVYYILINIKLVTNNILLLIISLLWHIIGSNTIPFRLEHGAKKKKNTYIYGYETIPTKNQ